MQEPVRPSSQAKGSRRYQCVCGNERCKSLTDELALLASDRGGYEEIPTLPNNPGSNGSTRRKPNRMSTKERKHAVSRRWAVHLGEGVRAETPKRKFVSRIHFPAEVTAQAAASDTSSPKPLKSLIIKKELGETLGYTAADRSPAADGTFLPVPNRTIADAEDELKRRKVPTPFQGTTHVPSAGVRSVVNPVTPVNISVEEFSTMKRQNELLRAQLAAAHEKLTQADSDRVTYLAGLTTYEGLNRFTLQCDDWHKKHPKAANHLFGFKSWHETKVHLRCFWPDVKKPDPKTLQIETDMSMYEKLLITKMRFQRAMSEDMLALIWGRVQSSINFYVHECAPMWGEVGRHLSILDIDEEYLNAEIPDAFTDLGLGKVGAMPDGKDFMTDTSRVNTAIGRAMWSDKVHHSGARCISWTTPAGLAFERTVLYMARASETACVATWREVLKKIPAGRLVLADRGFSRDAILYPNFNVHLTPCFLTGRDQFTSGEVESDRRKCELRYTSETAFSRVTCTTGLRDSIPRSLFTIMEDMCDWGHAYINLCAPMQPPSGAPEGYFNNSKAKEKKEESKRKRRSIIKEQKRRRRESQAEVATAAQRETARDSEL